MLALHNLRLGASELRQAIVRIVVVHGGGCDQLVFDKHGRGNRALVQDVETNANDVLSIFFRKVSDRTYKASLGFAQFGSAFWRSVLPHDGAILGASRFLECAQRSQRAGVVDAADQYMPGMRRPQMPPDCFKAGAEFSIAFKISDAAV